MSVCGKSALLLLHPPTPKKESNKSAQGNLYVCLEIPAIAKASVSTTTAPTATLALQEGCLRVAIVDVAVGGGDGAAEAGSGDGRSFWVLLVAIKRRATAEEQGWFLLPRARASSQPATGLMCNFKSVISDKFTPCLQIDKFPVSYCAIYAPQLLAI